MESRAALVFEMPRLYTVQFALDLAFRALRFVLFRCESFYKYCYIEHVRMRKGPGDNVERFMSRTKLQFGSNHIIWFCLLGHTLQ